MTSICQIPVTNSVCYYPDSLITQASTTGFGGKVAGLLFSAASTCQQKLNLSQSRGP